MVTITSGFERWTREAHGKFAAPKEESGVRRICTKPPRPDRELILPYTPFPRQEMFHASPAKYRLFAELLARASRKPC